MSHVRTIKRKDGTKSYRAIIKSGGKEFGKTFPKRTLANQWAARIVHDAGLTAAHGCPGAIKTLQDIVNEHANANRDEWSALPESQTRFWLDHLGAKTKYRRSADN